MMSASNAPSSVTTRFACGSMPRIVDRTNRTPGFTRSAYGCTTSFAVVRPNITSSFENPKTNPSDLSMRTRSRSVPNSSDNSAVSSSPPNPAPSTTTLIPHGNHHHPVECDEHRSWRGVQLRCLSHSTGVWGHQVTLLRLRYGVSCVGLPLPSQRHTLPSMSVSRTAEPSDVTSRSAGVSLPGIVNATLGELLPAPHFTTSIDEPVCNATQAVA